MVYYELVHILHHISHTSIEITPAVFRSDDIFPWFRQLPFSSSTGCARFGFTSFTRTPVYTPVREDHNVENAARPPSDPALPIDDARRVSIDNIYQTQSLASPLESQPPLPPLPHAEPHRRLATLRLATPARLGAHAPAGSCPPRAALPPSALPGTWTKTRHRQALYITLLGPQQTAWSVHAVHAPTMMGFVRNAPRSRTIVYTPCNRNSSLSVGGGRMRE
ncbi:hypothetical protein BGY98DRAFT_33194 [Russula aff. rugulosa BPL654]|nr:hypothetical protein BGY98DRAFT_33194 [Russula aff. rugulosa BPL654]